MAFGTMFVYASDKSNINRHFLVFPTFLAEVSIFD